MKKKEKKLTKKQKIDKEFLIALKQFQEEHKEFDRIEKLELEKRLKDIQESTESFDIIIKEIEN